MSGSRIEIRSFLSVRVLAGNRWLHLLGFLKKEGRGSWSTSASNSETSSPSLGTKGQSKSDHWNLKTESCMAGVPWQGLESSTDTQSAWGDPTERSWEINSLMCLSSWQHSHLEARWRIGWQSPFSEAVKRRREKIWGQVENMQDHHWDLVSLAIFCVRVFLSRVSAHRFYSLQPVGGELLLPKCFSAKVQDLVSLAWLVSPNQSLFRSILTPVSKSISVAKGQLSRSCSSEYPCS